MIFAFKSSLSNHEIIKKIACALHDGLKLLEVIHKDTKRAGVIIPYSITLPNIYIYDRNSSIHTSIERTENTSSYRIEIAEHMSPPSVSSVENFLDDALPTESLDVNQQNYIAPQFRAVETMISVSKTVRLSRNCLLSVLATKFPKDVSRVRDLQLKHRALTFTLPYDVQWENCETLDEVLDLRGFEFNQLSA